MLCPTDPKGDVSTSAGLLLFGAKQKAKFKVGSLCNLARGNDSDYSDRHRSLPAFCQQSLSLPYSHGLCVAEIGSIMTLMLETDSLTSAELDCGSKSWFL